MKKIQHTHQPGEECSATWCPVAAYIALPANLKFGPFKEAWPGGIEKKTTHEATIKTAQDYMDAFAQEEAAEIIESLLKMIDKGAMAPATRGDVENRQPAQILRQMLTWSEEDIMDAPNEVRRLLEEALRAVLQESRETEERAKNVQEQAEARTVVGVLDFWLAEINRSIRESRG